MSNSPQVLLTTDQIDQWEREFAESARIIAEQQARQEDLRTKLKAAEIFRPKPVPERDRQVFVEPPLLANDDTFFQHTITAEPPPKDGDNLVAAIEKIANDAPRPVSKKELKKILAEQGFAADRLANYFYTAIHRLKTKERITVRADGSVWKDPHTLEAQSD